MKPEDIEVKVEFTEGYEKRYTQACLNAYRRREEQTQINSEERTEKTA